MAALELLASQHREAMELLAHIRGAENGAVKVRLMGALAEALTLHMTLEEKFLYPLLSDVGYGDLSDRSLREHGIVKRLISDMLDLKRNDPRLEQVFLDLDHNVRAHVEEEEKSIFPRLREKVEESRFAELERVMREAISRLQNEELLEVAEGERAPTV